jgi:beta-glucosidase-like glycosyl hydrolase
MSDFTLEEKLGQMLIASFQGHQAPSHIIDWLWEGRIGGVILFARNIDSPRQLRALTQELRKARAKIVLNKVQTLPKMDHKHSSGAGENWVRIL